MYRRLSLLFAFLALSLPGLVGAAADVDFLRVWTGWRNAESFDRISEYFGRGENTGRQHVLRTQADARAGYYFLVRISSTAASPGAQFELSIIRPDTPEARVYTFPVSFPARETVFQLGVTGTDWPGGPKANPVAWKLALIGADGQVLKDHKSFLWEMPTK